jgi:hypothetical protein
MQDLSNYCKENYHDFKMFFWRPFQEYSNNIPPKVITEAIKKQVGVVHVISFTPFHY